MRDSRDAIFVVITGLPGSGKSTLARALAERVSFVYLELDRMEGPLFEHGVNGDDLGWGGYRAITALAEDNLRLGHGVILDSVGWTNELRRTWRALSDSTGSAFRPIEVACSDLVVHRSRVERRAKESRSGWANPTWQSVEARRSVFEPWQAPRLILDSVRPLAELVDEAEAYVLS